MSFRVLTVGMVASLGLCAGVKAAPSEEIAPEHALREAGLVRYWQAQLPFQRGDSPVAAYLIDDSLYITTRLGDLHAVDPGVGRLRWTHAASGRDKRVFKPSHLSTVDGREATLVAHSEGAYVYDRGSGAVLAKVPGLWIAGSAPVGDAVSFYVGGNDGYVHAIQWYNPTHHKPIHTWKVFGGGPITSTPLLFDGVLCFASQNGSVYACTADWNKKLRWQHATEAAIIADLFGDESGVYVASLDRSLYRLNVTTGASHWRYRFPKPLRDAPIVSQRTVYQYCRGFGLYAIDVDSYELLWKDPLATAFVSRRADRTCVRRGEDAVAVLDSTSGKPKGVVPIPARSVVTTNPDAITFYVTTPDGAVGCFTSSGVRYLRADDILRGLTPPGGTDSPGSAKSEPTAEPDNSDMDPDDPLRSRSDR